MSEFRKRQEIDISPEGIARHIEALEVETVELKNVVDSADTRERLARVHCRASCKMCRSEFCVIWNDTGKQWEDDRADQMRGIDAILAEQAAIEKERT